ncbi:MAG: hypothetical protein D6B28_01010 [Gammaproteobacteria bacterium]|nr:MAG: hypothetical protein D6B28_01010 [Gammaproteobacteria bacterium]
MSFEQAFPIGLIISFTIFSIFRYFQSTCLRDFQGLSGGVKTMLDVVSVFGMVFEYGILVYYGFIISPMWYYAIALFIISFVIKNILYKMATLDKSGKTITVIAMLGFIGIPLSLLGILFFFYQVYEGMGYTL